MSDQATGNSGALDALNDVDIHDRVMEAYYGAMGETFMRETQERIHWICSNVVGNNVMDIGCSQGIVPILLAREGCSVVGVDISPKSIAEALEYLNSEPEHVRKNINYINKDFISFDPSGYEIDTLILSEVLEHLTRPEVFVEKAASILKKNDGALIITVPFGINAFIDHKQTFYFFKPYSYLAKHFGSIEYFILGKWIGFVAKEPGGTTSVDDFFSDIMLALEAGFYGLESDIRAKNNSLTLQGKTWRDKASKLSGSLSEAKQKYREMTEQVSGLKSELAKQTQAHAQLELALTKLQAQLQNKEKALVASIAENRRILQSASYQAGYHVVRAGKSFPGFLKLPLALWRIARNKKFLPATGNNKKKSEVAAGHFLPPSKLAADISILGWPEYPDNGKPYVMAVMDEFTTGCFEQAVNLIQPRPDNWYALAEKYRPTFIFIESAWKGNHGSWQYRVAEYANKPGNEIEQICRYAREKGIPTLFWNKEDPVHHDKFMCSAKLVDHIFTTDASMRGSYQAKTKNSNVHVLPFAAQPALHRPAALDGRKSLSCFAGSWYGNRHEERGLAIRWLLDAANKRGLEIYDRNYGTGSFPFPDEYQACIKGRLPYKELCKEYSRYRVFLNVNSVTESPTMFSRRVFELMACGTPIVSTYSKGIENLFSSQAVWLVNSKDEADEAIYTLMTDDDEWRRRSLAGIREVFSKHTYAHRLNDISVRLGLEGCLLTEPAIVLAASARTAEELSSFNQFAKDQEYRHFRLGVETPQGIAIPAGQQSDSLVILQPGEGVSWLQKQEKHDLAGCICSTLLYGEYYLRDLVNATLYAPDANGWTKSLGDDVFDYGRRALLGASLWKRDLFIEKYMKVGPNDQVEADKIYLADSDQISYPLNVSNKDSEVEA